MAGNEVVADDELRRVFEAINQDGSGEIKYVNFPIYGLQKKAKQSGGRRI